MSAPVHDAHDSSCSPAGAERVGRREQHLDPSVESRRATLPTVVVLPTPLTPTNSQTSTGVPSSAPSGTASVASWFANIPTRSDFSASTSTSGPVISPAFTLPRRSSTSASVAFTPTSARMSASSRSSHVAESTRDFARVEPR